MLGYLSLPLLGSIADGFDDWLITNGYTLSSRECLIRFLPYVDSGLRRDGIKEVADLTHPVLHDCWRNFIRPHPCRAGAVRKLERYLVASGWVANDQAAATTFQEPHCLR